MLRSRKFVSFVLVVILALALPLSVAADNPFAKPWTTVASAGTVDEADASKINYTEATARMNLAVPANSSAMIRYNVVAVDGLADAGGDGIFMRVRFRDSGQDERVIVRLKSVDIATGAIVTLLTLDSNAFAGNVLFQTQSVGTCSPNWRFDFNKFAYFVEATLSKGSTLGNPGLSVVQIGKTLC